MYLYFSILRFLCIKLLSLQEFPHFLPIRFSFSASFSSAGRVLQKQPVRFRCRILKKSKTKRISLCGFSHLQTQQYRRCTYRALPSGWFCGQPAAQTHYTACSPGSWYLFSLKSLCTNMQSITKQCVLFCGRVFRWSWSLKSSPELLWMKSPANTRRETQTEKPIHLYVCM